MKKPELHPTFPLRLTTDQMCLLLGSISQTIEESGAAFNNADLRQLVGLHERLCILSAIAPDYAVLNGAVVHAQHPGVVIVPAPVHADEIDQTRPGVANG